MTLQEKIQDLNNELGVLQSKLQQLDQERQQLTTEIIKKVGALEVLDSLNSQDPDKTE